MNNMDNLMLKYPEKFVPEVEAFKAIRRGDRLFISTGCGEPQYLVNALVGYVQKKRGNILGTEILHVWTLGVAPYTNPRFEKSFRYNSFFIGSNTREAVNTGRADYTPIFLSHVPELFTRGLITVDVALIQVSPPDVEGNMSLGISVDVTRSALENARVTICQVNRNMPHVHGDTIINIRDVDFVIPYDEPLLEYSPTVPDELAEKIGRQVGRIIEDGDTIQVGYGSVPNAVLVNLRGKNNLGVHTELLTDGIADLMREGVIDNTHKSFDRKKTVASFCMASRRTYDYLDNNPAFEFKPIDYTNNPLIIAGQKNITAINSALAVDLTGQATAESIGDSLYSGIGGLADFMRGAVMAPGGKSILVLASTTRDGKLSRIIPRMEKGAKVTLTSGDTRYVVTEYGTAYLHGKSIRDRAMELIAIAHPDFRSWLIEEARRLHYVYEDQKYVPGKEGEYPEEYERYRRTRRGLDILLRPVKISDETMLKDFFYSLSDKSNYKRFFTLVTYMPHKMLQEMSAINYIKEMVLLAVIGEKEKTVVAGVAQYTVPPDSNLAEFAIAVRDDYQKMGVGSELLRYQIEVARREGLRGFTGEYIPENRAIEQLLEECGLKFKKWIKYGLYRFELLF